MMGVVALSGCESTGATFRPNDELFEYTCYAKGSYWVYEDSATHGIDSIVVITKPEKSISSELIQGQGSRSRVKTFNYQYNYINRDKAINDTILFEPTVQGDLNRSIGDCPDICYIFPPYPNGKCARSAFALTYINLPNPLNDDIWFFETSQIPRFVRYYESLNIGANIYNCVKKITIKGKGIKIGPEFDSVITYWAKNIGVIRCECYEPTGSKIMNLVRYNVKNVKKKELYKR